MQTQEALQTVESFWNWGIVQPKKPMDRGLHEEMPVKWGDTRELTQEVRRDLMVVTDQFTPNHFPHVPEHVKVAIWSIKWPNN